MLKKSSLVLAALTTLCIADISTKNFNGAWHLRALDGMEVRKARAILDLDMDNMKLSGFDACNRIGGTLVKHTDANISAPMLMSTKMACRQNIHTWVSKRIHETLKEGFTLNVQKRYGIKGILLKSSHHELFLKRMQRD